VLVYLRPMARCSLLAGAYGSQASTAMPHLDTSTVTMATQNPLTF